MWRGYEVLDVLYLWVLFVGCYSCPTRDCVVIGMDHPLQAGRDVWCNMTKDTGMDSLRVLRGDVERGQHDWVLSSVDSKVPWKGNRLSHLKSSVQVNFVNFDH